VKSAIDRRQSLPSGQLSLPAAPTRAVHSTLACSELSRPPEELQCCWPAPEMEARALASPCLRLRVTRAVAAVLRTPGIQQSAASAESSTPPGHIRRKNLSKYIIHSLTSRARAHRKPARRQNAEARGKPRQLGRRRWRAARATCRGPPPRRAVPRRDTTGAPSTRHRRRRVRSCLVTADFSVL
jgi:hypothetical protein